MSVVEEDFIVQVNTLGIDSGKRRRGRNPILRFLMDINGRWFQAHRRRIGHSRRANYEVLGSSSDIDKENWRSEIFRVAASLKGKGP